MSWCTKFPSIYLYYWSLIKTQELSRISHYCKILPSWSLSSLWFQSCTARRSDNGLALEPTWSCEGNMLYELYKILIPNTRFSGSSEETLSWFIWAKRLFQDFGKSVSLLCVELSESAIMIGSRFFRLLRPIFDKVKFIS